MRIFEPCHNKTVFFCIQNQLRCNCAAEMCTESEVQNITATCTSKGAKLDGYVNVTV